MRRTHAKFAIDLALWSVATPLAFVLRLEDGVSEFAHGLAVMLAVGVPLKALTLGVLEFPRRSWHRLGLQDLPYLGVGVGLVTAALALVVLLVPGVAAPRSVPFIEGMIALLLMSGARVAARVWYERQGMGRARRRTDGRRVLIVGAGEAGTMVARELGRHRSSGRVPVGFLDDDPLKRRQRFVGLRVLGTIEDLVHIVDLYGVDEVLLAIPTAPGALVRRVVELVREAGVEHRSIPGIYELLNGTVSIDQTHEVKLEDLLRREPVRLDVQLLEEAIHGKRVLVTGAGGSIGSEIVRQVAMYNPRRVVLLGRGENSVYTIHREMRRRWPDVEAVPVICDVRDRDSLRRVFEEHRPEMVYHAGAHKHVPLMEANPEQAVFNNVLGTKNVAQLARDHGTSRLVNISTDKAVNPTSVMGASKRVAEQVVLAVSQRCAPDQAFVSVRFGNVLGSRGSVVPLFKEQIAYGGPITVTHPDMVRYFMTIPEASQLVLQAGVQGENGQVYVLDMGEPVRIVDLARDLILLSGLEPDKDIAIEYSGARPGEKLFEELLTSEEGVVASPHDKIFVARKSAFSAGPFERHLGELVAAADAQDPGRIRDAFRALIPTHQLGGPGPNPLGSLGDGAGPGLPSLSETGVGASE